MINPKLLHLFPDTNVFLQCKPLQQVNWSTLGEWDEIHLVISRPVQTEIDAFKGKGNNRQASRARRASALIRELLDADNYRIKLCNHPIVYLCLKHDLRRDDTVSDILDYQERDDQLVGIALAFQKAHTDADVRLLTHDTGPMASARAVTLKYFDIPDEWLLPPETDETNKRLKSLQDELLLYKQAEPNFDIKVWPEKQITSSIDIYSALTNIEVQQLLNQLTATYPETTDFGSMLPDERILDRSDSKYLGSFGVRKEIYKPVTQEKIDIYRDAYAEWENNCGTELSDLNSFLNSIVEWPRLVMSIENVGTRPAERVLIVFEALGDIWITAPKKTADEDDNSTDISLPVPPSAPKGSWEKEKFLIGLREMSNFANATTRHYPDSNFSTLESLLSSRDVLLKRDDPNAFYFKKGQRGVPTKIIEYTCEQWRHACAPEDFGISIDCTNGPGLHRGCVKVTVHASNLTEPASLNIPVQITIYEKNCRTLAEEMIDKLKSGTIHLRNLKG